MRDPVVASDGFTYERTAIERWLAIRDTSPMSNAPLPMKVRVSTNHLKVSAHHVFTIPHPVLPSSHSTHACTQAIYPNLALRHIINDWRAQHGLGELPALPSATSNSGAVVAPRQPLPQPVRILAGRCCQACPQSQKRNKYKVPIQHGSHQVITQSQCPEGQ